MNPLRFFVLSGSRLSCVFVLAVGLAGCGRISSLKKQIFLTERAVQRELAQLDHVNADMAKDEATWRRLPKGQCSDDELNMLKNELEHMETENQAVQQTLQQIRETTAAVEAELRTYRHRFLRP